MLLRAAFCTLAALAVSCGSTESIDWTGEWVGTVNRIVAGERTETLIRLLLEQEDSALGGAIIWEGMPRRITSASVRGRELTIEAATASERMHLTGSFRNDSLSGRFSIVYASNPEVYSGGFEIARKR